MTYVNTLLKGCIFSIFFVLFFTLQTAYANTLSISATVPANPNSYSATLSSSTPGTTFPENTQLDYTIVYGTTLTDTNPLTVQATWTQGTISGDTHPSIDVLQYVTNSASDAYGATQPIIDPINRTITWSINNFPGHTQGQIVHFSVATTNNYTAQNTVSFSVQGRAIGIGTQTPDSTLSATYEHTQPTIPPPTSTPAPSSSTTINPTSTASVTTIPTPFTIQQISMQTISQDKASILIHTSLPSQINLFYGTTSKNLNKKIIDQTTLRNHSLQVDNLQAQTYYYFKIIATASNGQERTSDLYTFLTARTSQVRLIDQNSLTLVDNGVIVFDQGLKDKMNKNIASVTKKTSVNFSFTVPNPPDIVSVQSFLRNASVLSVPSVVPELDTTNQLIPLAEIEPGVFHGTLVADQPAGEYFLVARIIDRKGNLSEQNLVNIHIILPLHVQDAKNQELIAHVQAILSFQSATLGQFNLLLPEQIPIANPVYSDNQGDIILPLPQGVYNAHMSASGYQDQDVVFTIGTTAQDGYPTVNMHQLPFNLLTFVSSLGVTSADILTTLKLNMQSAAYSHRFITLTATIVVLLFLFLTLMAFRFKHGLPLYLLPLYVLYHAQQVLPFAKKENICKGIITDTVYNRAIPGVQLYFADTKNKKGTAIFATTNTLGEFAFSLPKTTGYYTLELHKHGYQTANLTERFDASALHPLQISLQKIIAPTSFVDFLRWATVDLLQSLFTTLLLLSFFFEILLGYIFGWGSTFLFFAISFVNLTLWLKHIYHIYIM